MFTNAGYANMHFVFSFCSGNGRAAMALMLLCRISNHKTLEIVHRTLRDNGSSPQVNAECEQQWCAEAVLLLPGDHTNHL